MERGGLTREFLFELYVGDFYAISNSFVSIGFETNFLGSFVRIIFDLGCDFFSGLILLIDLVKWPILSFELTGDIYWKCSFDLFDTIDFLGFNVIFDCFAYCAIKFEDVEGRAC